MGSFTLPLQQKALICLLVFSAQISAKEIANIKLPDTILCEGKEVLLQGSGLRKATILGIKVYVLGFYASAPVSSGDDVALLSRPMCFDIYYLRNFDNEDVDKAWEFQFEESSMFPYPQQKEHIMELKKYFGEIKEGGKHTFSLAKDLTKIYENDKLKGEISSEAFQKNFLSVWFGKKPPTKELQEGLFQKKAN